MDTVITTIEQANKITANDLRAEALAAISQDKQPTYKRGTTSDDTDYEALVVGDRAGVSTNADARWGDVVGSAVRFDGDGFFDLSTGAQDHYHGSLPTPEEYQAGTLTLARQSLQQDVGKFLAGQIDRSALEKSYAFAQQRLRRYRALSVMAHTNDGMECSVSGCTSLRAHCRDYCQAHDPEMRERADAALARGLAGVSDDAEVES